MAQWFFIFWNQGQKAIWLILAVAVMHFVFKKVPKKFSLMLWVLVAVRLVFPFEITSPFSLNPEVELMSQEAVTDPLPSKLTMFTPTEVGKLPERVYTGAEKTSFSAMDILAFVVICGQIGLLGYFVIGYRKLKKSVAASVRMEENVWICDEIDTPFILGVFKPQIYLPSTLSKEETAQILLHERAHIRRKDPLWKMLGFLFYAFYWCSPAAIMTAAYRVFLEDIELACDEDVIREMSLEERKVYSRVLLNVSSSKFKILSCPLAFGEVSVKERIKTILNYKKHSRWISVAAVLVMVVMAACFLTDREDAAIIGGADGPTAVFVGLQRKEHKELETVRAELAAFPENPKELAEQGCFVRIYSHETDTVMPDEVMNVAAWNRFCKESLNERSGTELVIANFTAEKGLVLEYLSYDGIDYYHVYDFSRSDYAKTEGEYYEKTYPYFYLYQMEGEDGNYAQVSALSDVMDMSLERIGEVAYINEEDGMPRYQILSLLSFPEDYVDENGEEIWYRAD